MKRMISTKVDEAAYAKFLEYCAEVNKYPANALRDALNLLLDSTKTQNKSNIVNEKLTELSELNQQPKEREEKIDPDEAELDIF